MKTIIAILIIIAIFIGSKKLVCTPDHKVVEVSLPLAKVIVEYIEDNGVPEYLNDIEGLPYDLKDCKKTKHIENETVSFIEKCFFYKNNKGYILKFNAHKYENTDYFTSVYIDVKNPLVSKCSYIIRYSTKKQKWDYDRYPYPNIWKEYKSGICNPKLFRITD